jgi:lipoyl synthase
LNHNLETVPRLYRRVRPGALFHRSLELLARARESRRCKVVKTGIMLGLGESEEEVISLMEAARLSGAQCFTAGQYLRPSLKHLPVENYLSEDDFARYRALAKDAGFDQVFIGPLVRSSYHADLLHTGSDQFVPRSH